MVIPITKRMARNKKGGAMGGGVNLALSGRVKACILCYESVRMRKSCQKLWYVCVCTRASACVCVSVKSMVRECACVYSPVVQFDVVTFAGKLKILIKLPL